MPIPNSLPATILIHDTSSNAGYVSINPFAPGDFAEKRVLKLVEWFSAHCRAIKR